MLKTVTDADYHLTFGLHSGIPLCCAIEYADIGNYGGPCKLCKGKGITREEFYSKVHCCNENKPGCLAYIEQLELATFNRFVEHRSNKPTNLIKGELDEFTWGANLRAPLSGYFRDALHKQGYLMVHLCWPASRSLRADPSTYWYIFQQDGGKKGKCGACSTKFSLKLRTVGKQPK